jgi:membrane-bound ClpP family serine protease
MRIPDNCRNSFLHGIFGNLRFNRGHRVYRRSFTMFNGCDTGGLRFCFTRRRCSGRNAACFACCLLGCHNRNTSLIVDQGCYIGATKRFIVYINVSHLTANPDIALVLLTLGALGIYLEFLRPGTIIPGVCGSVLFLFGFAGFSHDWRGAAAVSAALLLFLLEAKTPARHVLSAVGTILMPFGAILSEPRLHFATAVLTLVPFALITSFLAAIAVRARCNKMVRSAAPRYPV